MLDVKQISLKKKDDFFIILLSFVLNNIDSKCNKCNFFIFIALSSTDTTSQLELLIVTSRLNSFGQEFYYSFSVALPTRHDSIW